jgi:hypothetical protein
VSWHWDERSGRRTPTSRRAHLGMLAERLPVRALLVAVGLPLWAWGIVEFVTGSYYGGGALVFAGGLLLVLAAGGGWRRFRAALLDWLGN